MPDCFSKLDILLYLSSQSGIVIIICWFIILIMLNHKDLKYRKDLENSKVKKLRIQSSQEFLNYIYLQHFIENSKSCITSTVQQRIEL